MNSTAWKVARAEDEAAPLLRRAAAMMGDESLSSVFPRDICSILQLAVPGFSSYRVPDLTSRKVVEHLREIYGIDGTKLLENGDAPLGGFTYAAQGRVIVFVETSHGPAFELFTWAHEAGHIAKEFLPLLNPPQLDIFAPPPPPPYFAHRCSVDVIRGAGGFGFTDREQEARFRAGHLEAKSRERETIANSIAAALLAPADAVRQVIREAPSTEPSRLLQKKFGLSASAAEIRLKELDLAPQRFSRI